MFSIHNRYSDKAATELTDEGIASAGNTYFVDIKQWGITASLPSKPYTEQDYNQAAANVKGINDAISWAASKHFSTIILPGDSYSICYPYSIIISQSNITIDFNNSILKVMYDSDNKSPFDTRVDADDYYNYPTQAANGVCLKLQGAFNSHIKNLILIGDKAERSFNASAEAAVEYTYGIQITKSSSYCTIQNCTISSFMADGIAIVNSSDYEYAEFALGLTVNDIDTGNGSLIASTRQTLVSQFINLPGKAYNCFLLSGAGYTRLTAMNVKDIGVYYYDSAGNFLGNYDHKKIYIPIPIIANAAKFRLLFYNETQTSKNMQITLKYGLTPHHNRIEHNEIYNIHRGGIQLGGNYNSIADNMIHDGTGKLDGKPYFSDPTRYGINQEDSYGDNNIIRNNQFYNLFHGILAGCWTLEIHNNQMNNLSGIGVNLYALHSASVKENYFYRCQTAFGLMTSYTTGAHIFFENNTIVYTNTTGVSGSGYHVSYLRNTFIDSVNFFLPDDRTVSCQENRFVWTEAFAGNPSITANLLEHCSFEGIAVQREVQFRVNKVIATDMSNVNLRIESRNQQTKADTVEYVNCVFADCILNNNITSVKQRTAKFDSCRLEDTIIKIGNINTPSESPITTLTDCMIEADTIPYLFLSELNTGTGSIEALHCDITINNDSFPYLLKAVYPVVPRTTSVILKQSRLSFTGTGELSLLYYEGASKNAVQSFANIRNIQDRILFPAGDSGIYLDYDPSEEGVMPPQSGSWFAGELFKNAAPAAGGYVGWVCVQSGIANGTEWAPATSFSQSQQIQAGGHIYEAVSSGNSGSAEPAWPLAHGATVTDGSITWKESGVVAIFKPYGLIVDE